MNLPVSSQLPATTASSVSEGTSGLELLHTLLQMKSIPLRRDWELSVLQPASPSGQNLCAMTLELGLGTRVCFSLNGTPPLGAECSVEEKGYSLRPSWLASRRMEPLPRKPGQGMGAQCSEWCHAPGRVGAGQNREPPFLGNTYNASAASSWGQADEC